MPIATYKTYKCPKCGYKKTTLQSDVILTSACFCPICGSEMKLVGSTTNPLDSVFDVIKDLFCKNKK